MAKFDWNETKRQITDSQAWQSIFRHGYEDTPRNRILMVSGNVWLHLHPSKVQKHTVRLRFTWCMGGITFLLFLVTVITGVYLMFYYRPTAEYAYADMKYLEFDMPFGMLMRNMHRWAAHGMVIAVWLHMFRVFMTGSYKPPREFNWAHFCSAARKLDRIRCCASTFCTAYSFRCSRLSSWRCISGGSGATGCRGRSRGVAGLRWVMCFHGSCTRESFGCCRCRLGWWFCSI